MPLDLKDFELVERIMYKCADDVTISINRSIDRLSERCNSLESRMYSRIGDIEEKIEDTKHYLIDVLETLREEIRDIRRSEV